VLVFMAEMYGVQLDQLMVILAACGLRYTAGPPTLSGWRT
jgi:hypothetical protein